jgi:hypothetical protein
MNSCSKLASLVGLAFSLTACVSNPSDMANTLNTVSQVAGAAQGMRGGGVPGGANALAGGMGAGGIGGNSVGAMSNAQGDPRFARAEDALKQLNFSTASCKDMQAKKQATLNSLAEIEPLTANLMFKQQHERLRIQNDTMGGIANAKKCKLPTVATINANGSVTAAAAPAVTYSKLNCSKLKAEYSKLTSDLSAAETAEKANAQAAQTQGGIAAIAQIGAMLGGNSGMGGMGGIGGAGNAQQVQQMAQMAGALSGAAGGATPTAAPAVSSMTLLQQKTEIESAANKKRCNLGS